MTKRSEVLEATIQMLDTLADQLKRRTVEVELQKARMVMLGLSKQSKGIDLFSEQELQVMQTYLEISLRKVCKEGLVGLTPEVGMEPVPEASLGQKRKRPGLLDDDADDVLPQQSACTAQNIVRAEIAAWQSLTTYVINKHKHETSDGGLKLVNHFSLFTELPEHFPLHYAVFRQFAPTLVHEGNVERVFSAAKLAAHPNMDAEKLSRRIYIQHNLEAYPVSLENVKARYIKKYGSCFLVSS